MNVNLNSSIKKWITLMWIAKKNECEYELLKKNYFFNECECELLKKKKNNK